ncbi:MAG: cation diffusion facilitator family transporter [Geobacter sp.]|nr:cation diffusion facilitator family transporter [Geobacter sp.]
MQRDERFDKAEKIIQVGFWVNAVLMVMKLAAGYWGRSDAVFADGIESACDFIAIGSTMIALKLGRQPYDEQHPYGHGRAESLAALLISLVICATGIWIFVDAVQTILRHDFKAPGWIAVAAAALTIIIKEWLYRFSSATGTLLESPSLLAIAQDHRKDAMTSIATLAGVAGAFLGWGIMDPLAAALTSFFILHIGWETFRGAAHDLMDGSVHGEYIQDVTKLAEAVEHVEHVHEIRARRSGQYIIIDLKLDMDPDMTVKQSHDVATEVKRRIFERFSNVGDVMIHINPHDEEHEDLIRL